MQLGFVLQTQVNLVSKFKLVSFFLVNPIFFLLAFSFLFFFNTIQIIFLLFQFGSQQETRILFVIFAQNHPHLQETRIRVLFVQNLVTLTSRISRTLDYQPNTSRFTQEFSENSRYYQDFQEQR